MLITKQLLVAIMPESSEVVVPFVRPIREAFEHPALSTITSQAAFLAQIGHESVRLTSLSPSLNYSATGLRRLFPQFFDENLAIEYAHKPLRIASRIYANKFGNRDEASTDGWWYRPRGLLPRIIGVSGYKRAAVGIGQSPTLFLRRPEMMSMPDWSTRVAIWFWAYNKCQDMADKDSLQAFKALTRTINGGLHGLQDRLYLYERAKTLLRDAKSNTSVPEISKDNASGSATAEGSAVGEPYGQAAVP